MDFEIRPAVEADIPDLSTLLLLATDGIVESLYEGLVPGRETHEIVERRLARTGTCDAWTNCWVAAQERPRGGRIAGKLHAYPLDDEADDPPDPLVPAARRGVLAPFAALYRVAGGSYYINVIAVYPAYRRQGLGRRLLALAEEQAAARGLRALSLAVFEENEAAVRLYRQAGFAEAARAPVVPHPVIPFGGDLLVMMRGV